MRRRAALVDKEPRNAEAPPDNPARSAEEVAGTVAGGALVTAATRQQLAAIRDEWLAPIIEQVSRLGRENGRLEAERDDIRALLTQAEAARSEATRARGAVPAQGWASCLPAWRGIGYTVVRVRRRTQGARMGDRPERGQILVVEDDLGIAALLTDVLEDEGYRVTTSVDGAAVLLALASPPDLVLTDVLMPGLDGTEVCRQLKADPRTRAVPVVLMTALPPDLVAARIAGCAYEGLLHKPFDVSTILATVARHLAS